MEKEIIKLLSQEIPDLEIPPSNVCVYLHVNSNNEVFYVGIGNNKRPYNRTGRSKEWLEYVKSICFDYKIEVLVENINYGEASEYEKNLIQMFGRKDKGLGTLLNKTDGGGWTEKYARLNNLYKKRKAKERYDKIKLLDKIEKEILLEAQHCKNLNDFKEKNPILFMVAEKLDFTKSICYITTNEEQTKFISTQEVQNKLEKIKEFVSIWETIESTR